MWQNLWRLIVPIVPGLDILAEHARHVFPLKLSISLMEDETTKGE